MEVREVNAVYQVASTYKQTEVGLVPSEWEVIPLGEIFKFKNGLNKAKEFFGYGTPIVNYMDVFQRTHLSAEGITGRVDVNTREISAYGVRQGDVFFTRTSETAEEIGLAAVIDTVDQDTVFSGFILRARPIDQSLDTKFKGYCFSAKYFRQQVIARASYTTRALTNGRSLSAAFLARPPLPEQRAIAAALSDVDALLATQGALIAKRRAIKQGTMQELLTGKRRLPGFDGEWKIKRLGEISEITIGRTPPRLNQAMWNGQHTWLSIADISGKHVSASKEQITDLAAQSMEHVPAGTLMMSFKLSIGRLCFAGSDLYTNEAICAFRDLTADAEFLYYMLGRVDFSLYGKQAVKGYTLNKESLRLVEVPLPMIEEQTAIAQVLSDMDADIAALEKCRAKTALLKQGMMQELLTGRTRLV